MMQLFKGKKVEEDNSDEKNIFDTILNRLEDIQDSIETIARKVEFIQDRLHKLSAPSEKLHNDLVDAKAQLRTGNEFMQKLVMQLIDAPRTIEVPKAPSTALEKYLAKRTGEDKPKLP